MKKHANGRCTLVGAGPGDPELLTLKAVKAIASATVILVDDLVNDAVLEHAASNARIVHVGKRSGCKSTPQAFIDKLMITAVQEGEHVVRLKGGDPFIFGRGGEEVEHLRAAGVEVQVINGITAGLAGLSSLGAPLTHRDHAHGVVFITGHAKPGSAGHDWLLLAGPARMLGLTLVIDMGVATAALIQQQLLAGGLPASTPVALVQSASLPAQQQILTDLGQMTQALACSGLGSPCVFVVGEVVRLAASYGEGLGGLLEQAQLRRAVVERPRGPSLGRRDGRVVARLMRDVAAGEELCNAYVDISLPVRRRRRELREYGFECDCARCERELKAADEKKATKADGKRRLK
jgi:uroporphyrin-III C-methyltransferase